MAPRMTAATATPDPVAAFLDAAVVPREGDHGSGTLDAAQAVLAAHPDLAAQSIHAAAALGDHEGVLAHLRREPGLATAKGGPRDWDALTHLCFSRYLRLDPARSEGFVQAATALLDACASANTGWFETAHQPQPMWESALYGAAGIAKHAGLTRLLLARGGDPNDGETPYHAPEGYDNAALRVLVESGKLSVDSLAWTLIRKADWHDTAGLRYLLEHDADPNRMTRWGVTALHQALRRDNALEAIVALLDHGADPSIAMPHEGRTGFALAARRGRGDVLAEFERRGISVELDAVDRLLAACARGDGPAVRSLVERGPQLVREVARHAGTLLAEFAGNGNTAGISRLLDLGAAVDARHGGDGYFGVAQNSTALHVAAWRLRSTTVSLLLERGASIAARDGLGRTPLMLAVRACVDSYWTARRTPEIVGALLRAGASIEGVAFPSGYAEADALLAAHGAR